MSSTFPIFLVLAVVGVLMITAWLATPKGPNQTSTEVHGGGVRKLVEVLQVVEFVL
ncbi:hypothetical protein PHLCEN_2v7205 [Hermanssonia centrifuga]|uniref:Uncharacterized protein n=1 Tax=Hermanssonia centrifuga TaxID=98765 RepID=A0A2R6NX62_9APHY|nr:hypothetical protein PHLCEN_2v7205 [Hermanssonia centrifuga]